MPRKKTVVLTMVAAFGFGFYQGAQMLSFVVGHYTSNPFSLFGLFVEGAVYLAFACLSWHGKEVRPKPLFASGAALGLLFMVLALINGQEPSFQLVFRTVASTSAACLLLCWAHVFSALPPFLSSVSIASAFMISALVKLFSGFVAAPETSESLYAQLLVFSCCLALLLSAVKMADAAPPRDREEKDRVLSSAQTTPQRLRRLYVGAAAFSVAYGMALQSDIEAQASHYAQSEHTALITFLLAGAILILSLLGSFKGNANYLFVIVAPCFGLTIALKDTLAADPGIGGSVNTAVLNLYYLMLWIMLAKEANRRIYPAFFLFGIGLAISRMALLCGRGAAALLSWEPASSWLGGNAAASLPLLVMLVAACLFIASNEKERKAGEPSQPLSEKSEPSDPWIVAPGTENPQIQTAWDKLSEAHGLSKREEEILFEFLQGRSSSYLADHLFISEHTVKTHIRRGYEKLGIHNRQELITLVQDQLAS
ncbi:MAG TPA: helix-turn-helix transcriptional regulator [Candidatus Rubneribacter avistercoris]|nr:helix-turn-helix transcriptional regulator [Candidatus Rubneribacter avistercoris]